MKMRTEIVADPDITTFNIAMPGKARLSVFEGICASEDFKQRNDRSRKQHRKPAKKAKAASQH